MEVTRLRFFLRGQYNTTNKKTIAGFHCHTIMKTIQQIKSRIKEIKDDEYSKSLTKVQVCAMFRAGDIRRNVFNYSNL